MNRRQFIRNIFVGTAGLGLSTGLYAWQVEPFWLEFVYRNLPIPNLPDSLIGKTLIQISDTHVGQQFDWNFIIDSFKKAQEKNPDFVVYTGDYITFDGNKNLDSLSEVMKHAVKGRLGTFGILGNHDYGYRWRKKDVADRVVEVLENAGIKILRNTHESSAGLNFIGVDDLWGTNFKPETAFENYDSSKANIVLCHNPDVCDLPVWGGYQGWILAGHTHGGQVKPPFLPPPIVSVKNRKYIAGEVNLGDGRMMYVNRALGNLFQIRFNVRPEITVFTLSKA